MNRNVFLLITIALVPVLGFGADFEISKDTYYKKNMAGWRGIIFICRSEDGNDRTIVKMCQRAVTDIELLAAEHKVDLLIAGPDDYIGSTLLNNEKNFVFLQLKLEATEETGPKKIRAVYGLLSYEKYFLNAIEKDFKPGSQENLPRSGKINLWTDGVIGIASEAEIVDYFGDGIELSLKRAIALYLKYAKYN